MKLMTDDDLRAVAQRLLDEKKAGQHSEDDDALLLFAKAIERIATQRALEAAAEVAEARATLSVDELAAHLESDNLGDNRLAMADTESLMIAEAIRAMAKEVADV